MWQRAVFLLMVGSIILGCASASKKQAMHQIHYVGSNDEAQCAALRQCRYIKDMMCFTRSPNRKMARCEVDFKRSTARAGGDTFLLQLTETNFRHGTYTAIGQAYDCSANTKQVKHTNYVPMRYFGVRVISDVKLAHCGLPKSCKPVKAINCRTRRGNPVRRCDTYVRDHTISAGGNTFVIEEKGFYAKNRGYILNGMAYNCPTTI